MFEYQIAQQKQQERIAAAEQRRVVKEAARGQRGQRKARRTQVAQPTAA